MAFPQRYLTPGALAALLLATALPSLAQTRQPPAFKTLLIAQSRERVEGLFYDNRGRQVSLAAMTERLSRAYPIPAGGVATLYRELPPASPDEKPQRLPVADLRLGPEEGPWLVLMSATPSPDRSFPQVHARVLDHSLRIHPPGTIRIFNFSQFPSMIQMEGRSLELSPGADTVVPYPQNPGQFELWVKAAFKTADGNWSLKISRPQEIVHDNTRALWIMTDVPPSPDFPEPSVLLRNLVEPVPPHPAPAK